MFEYFKSATKTVLIVMTLALISFVFCGIEIPQIFTNAYLIVIGFYFGQKDKDSEKTTDLP
jgi:hypothetical protein